MAKKAVGSAKSRQVSASKRTGRYVRQKARTLANKLRRWAKNTGRKADVFAFEAQRTQDRERSARDLVRQRAQAAFQRKRSRKVNNENKQDAASGG